MNKTTVTIYTCEYCGKEFHREEDCRDHEETHIEYCDEAELSFAVKLGDENGRCWVEARDEHGWIIESEIVNDKELPLLSCPLDKAVEKMVRSIINTAHHCY